MRTTLHEFQNTVKTNPSIKILLIICIALLLQIPLSLISNVISERAHTRDETIVEVTSKWGGVQAVIGPMILVPYTIRSVERYEEGKEKYTDVERLAVFFPEELVIDSDVESRSLRRGIFEVPVYTSNLSIRGRFSPPDFAGFGISPENIAWDKARLALSISDVRAVQDRVLVTWNGEDHEVLPGVGELARHLEYGNLRNGIHVPLEGLPADKGAEFAVRLRIKGSAFLGFAPLGRTTSAEIRSDWPHPSFQGNWLPESRDVGEGGFTAAWNVSSLGRNVPQQIDNIEEFAREIENAVFGVSLIQPVDPYRMAQRSVKYSILFITLTFASFWLFELKAGLRVHPIQYLLIGFALCVFYLLNVSLSEHLGFFLSYAPATAAVTVMVSAYSLVVLRSGWRAALIAGILVSLYACLYVLLMEEDYALLTGSVGLFLALGIIMFATRSVDWYGLGRIEGNAAASPLPSTTMNARD